MSTHTGTAATPGREARHRYPDEPAQGAGWLLFAGTLVMIAGFLNVIYGISGIGNAHWLEANSSYVFSSLKTWGWIVLIVGIAQLVAAFSIWAGNEYGRWVGIASAAVNSIVMLMFIPAYPFGALAVFAIDVLVIYGLAAYGGRDGAAV
jgi:glucan phosphoethanolaminetransferase (alkaline phosphatase superfamily)